MKLFLNQWAIIGFLFVGLTRLHAAGFPPALTMSWNQENGTFNAQGTLQSVSPSNYSARYDLVWYVNGKARNGIFTVQWDWPSSLRYTLTLSGVKCSGNAQADGINGFDGLLNCPTGSYPAHIY